MAALATLLIAYVARVLCQLAIDRHLQDVGAGPKLPGTDDDSESAPGSRLQTMLPLLRAAFGILVAVILALIVLSRLGIDTAPLFAGAQQDSEIAAEVILSLKLQGIAEITENEVIARFKFTARPVKPSWVQREYLKRMYQVFAEKGITFASGALTLQTGPHRPVAGLPGEIPGAAPPPVEAQHRTMTSQ